MIRVKVCFCPVLLKVPDTLQPLSVTNATGLVHFFFFGLQLSKDNVMAHSNICFFPHLNLTLLTVSSTARQEVVTKRKRTKPRSFVISKVWALYSLLIHAVTGRWESWRGFVLSDPPGVNH